MTTTESCRGWKLEIQNPPQFIFCCLFCYSCLRLLAGICCMWVVSNIKKQRVSKLSNARNYQIYISLFIASIFALFFVSFCLGKRNTFWLLDVKAPLNILESLNSRAFKKSPLSTTTLTKHIKASKCYLLYEWITSLFEGSVSWLFVYHP